MKDWGRIVLVIFMLLGATLSFGYWSLNKFDAVFDSLIASPAAIIPPVHSRPIVSETSSTTLASSTPPIDQNDLDSKFQLIFSPKKTGVYIGCTYEISWLASTTIKSLETTLIDACTRQPAGPVASGISKENIIDDDSQSLKWKVEVVWPGDYLISISNVNGVATDERSQKFRLNS